MSERLDPAKPPRGGSGVPPPDDIQAARYPAATYWLDRAMRAEARVTELATLATELLDAYDGAERTVIDEYSSSTRADEAKHEVEIAAYRARITALAGDA